MNENEHQTMLLGLFNHANNLYDALLDLSNEINDAGLTETSVSLGADDAIRALSRAIRDLNRRIGFSKERELAND